MKRLFIDNFRGFVETTISFDDVNFFVGENSTGKTTVLSLLKILTSQQFMYKCRLELSGIDFGTFTDMVNSHSHNKDFFSFGLELSAQKFILFAYENKQNMPVLSKIILKSSGSIFALLFFEKEVHAVTLDGCTIQNMNDAKNIIYNNMSFQQRPKEKLPIGMPVLFMLSYLRHDISKKEKNIKVTIKTGDISSSFNNETLWIAPIRTNPESLYHGVVLPFSPTGEHMPFVLRDLIKSKNGKFKDICFFGKKSGLFDSLVTKPLGDDNKTSPFSVYLAIGDTETNMKYMGYGVSQVLPILVDMLSANVDAILMQQPEVHLHPRAQAEFGSFLYEISAKKKTNFFIETHSDFIIDRFRLNVSRDKKYNRSAKVLFFSKHKGINNVEEILIGKDGKYPEEQPKEFRDFFINESLSLLEV